MKYVTGDYVGYARRRAHESEDGRIKLVPTTRGGAVEWDIHLDGIRLNRSRSKLKYAKLYVKAELERNGGKSLPGPTVLWVYVLNSDGYSPRGGGRREVVAPNYDEAVALAKLEPGQTVDYIIVSPRQRKD